MTSPPHDVAAELRSAGLAPTVQRRTVLAALDGHDHPVTAQELYLRLRAAGHRIGTSTVYRALRALAEAGLIHVFTGEGERAYRQCAPTPHRHLICRGCGLVKEYDGRAAYRMLADALGEVDFTPDPAHADVHGLCGSCRRSGTPDGPVPAVVLSGGRAAAGR